MESYKLCILEAGGGISNTIVFGTSPDENAILTNFYIHPDDSIRTIKMKLLHELHNGEHANKIQLRPSYEEIYLYAFVKEQTSTLKLFNALKTEDEPDPSIPLDLVKQMLQGHAKSKKILRKLSELDSTDKIKYSNLEDILSLTQSILSVKTPLGIQFAGGRRNPTFETDPFSVEKYSAYLIEHSDLHYFDNSLLLNYGEIVDNTIYVCLAGRVYETTQSISEDYIARYYYPGLYNAGVASNEQLAEKRAKLLKTTAELLTDVRLQYYRSIQTFYEISADSESPVNYLQKGIKSATIRIKNDFSKTANLEMLFKNLHSRKETPFIKFNPGNRREHLYRFYFERTTRTGKKIPYLSRTQIMRMSKTMGKMQQISIYLEGVVLSDRNVTSCYIHFETTGDIQLQFAFSKPIDERMLDEIITNTVTPYLTEIGRDVRQTGFVMPAYSGLRTIGQTQILSMNFEVKAPAKNLVDWESVPCIYAICTVHSDIPNGPLLARLKRVENFREMDAARILVTELYGQVQYGGMSLQDIVDELVSRSLVESDDTARALIAEVLKTTNEMDGEIVERPGFPLEMKIDKEDDTVSISASELTSVYYLDTVATYFDAIIKTTQIYKKTAHPLKQLNKLCKQSRKFKEIVEEPVSSPPALLSDAVRAPTIAVGPVKYVKQASDEDFFAQFDSEEEEEEEYKAPDSTIRYQEDDTEEAEDLLGRLRENANKKAPLLFDEDEEENTKEKETETEPKKPKPMLFEDEEEYDYQEEQKPSLAEMKSSLAQTIELDKKGPMLFEEDEDEDEEEETGGAKKNSDKGVVTDAEDEVKEDAEEEDEDDDNDENRLVPDGIPLKPVNPILKKLKKRDPELFATKSKGKYKGFSVSCQPTSRHPVILTKEELDKTNPEAYEHVIKYGSNPKNQHYFICPRFWCFLTNSAISEADVKAGKCGEIIPKNADVVPKGAYVYELNSEAQYPGFREDTRADGKCLPCCFKNWDGKTQSDARARCNAQMAELEEAEQAKEPGSTATKKSKLPPKKKAVIDKKTAQYIYSLDTYPVPEKRWGFLPIPVQLFLNIDYQPALDPGNPALLKSGKSVLLRYGVEQPDRQSFLGCFAHIYAHRQGLDKVPTVTEFRKILTERVTLDVFVKLHNGSLLSAFYPKSTAETKKLVKELRAKYIHTEFATGLNVQEDKAQKRYFDDAILSYENFIAYLNNSDVRIDHQYLWDLVCQPNERIVPKGLNLVIMEIKANDMIDRIELVCPTNLYSSQQFDSAKETVILLKHDDYYDPVFLYETPAKGSEEPIIIRFFQMSKIHRSIANVLKNIELTTRKFCPGMPSLPSIYKFAGPVPIKRVLEGLAKMDAKVTAQVVNYQGKTIGLMVKEKEHKGSVYLPCAPSARLDKKGEDGIDILYMDDLSIPSDYEKTTETLHRISAKTGIPCRPVRKIKEGGLVVGFLTETNQFVPIKPNEDIIMDGLRTYEGINDMSADKTVATSRKADREREKMTKYIVLESQFYHAFRNRARMLINEFANRKLKRDLMKIADDPTLLYSQKVKQIEPMLHTLIEDYVVFNTIGKSTLMDMAAVNECEDVDDAGPNCIIKENEETGIAQLVIPKKHLISKLDNERIYVGRLADELVRNERVKLFMYDTKNRLNARNVDYSIREDEFVLVKSALSDYFVEIDATGESNFDSLNQMASWNTNYETANPSISVRYPDERIPLEEQYQAPKQALGELTHDCLVNVVPIIGNKKQIWKRIFPDTAREWIFRNTAHCTFQPIMRIVESVLGEKWTESDTKRKLYAAYLNLLEKDSDNLSKIVAIMRKQGKSKMFERFIKAKADLTPESFESIVFDDEYYLCDMDYWALANEYGLPIILFNPNGIKGYSKMDWIRLGGTNQDKYHFVRSNIGSFATQIYEYNLIVPAVTLSQVKEFEDQVVESIQNQRPNTYKLEEMLAKVVVITNPARVVAKKD